MKFIPLVIFAVTLLSSCVYIIYTSTPPVGSNAATDYFTYKTPDDSIWINKDKEALRRLREHYVNESDQIIASLEAEKNSVIQFSNLDPDVQHSLSSTYNLDTGNEAGAQKSSLRFTNLTIINSIITTVGFALFYLFCAKQSNGKDTHKPSKQAVESEVVHKNIATSPESDDDHQVLNKAKDIICEILQAINKHSDNCLIPRRKELEDFTNDRLLKIRSSFTIEEFLAHENEIKKTIPSHLVRAKELVKTKFDELKTLINSFADDLGAITRGNSDFSGQIKSSMTHIESAIELDEIKEIRKRITTEVDKVGEIVLEKQNRDQQTIDSLTRRVRALDEELVSAREESLIDGLTQLYNRKAFDRKLADAMEENPKSTKSFALIMADIDFFKNINDEYGHMVGDDVLKRVSALLKKTFRLNDFVARFGGEEFVILIDRIDKQFVYNLCERLRSDIESLDFKSDTITIPTSISIGVAFCNKSDTQEILLDRADKALYLAKQSGRNIVKTEDQLGSTAAASA